uniref:Uncharacterized protein n=1 Tax=Sipha flava TaxID=143950 RepID=A0A2S2Q9R0_9HEMI
MSPTGTAVKSNTVDDLDYVVLPQLMHVYIETNKIKKNIILLPLRNLRMSFTVHWLPMTQIDCRFLFFFYYRTLKIEEKTSTIFPLCALLTCTYQDRVPGEPCKEKRLPHGSGWYDQKRFSPHQPCTWS